MSSTHLERVYWNKSFKSMLICALRVYIKIPKYKNLTFNNKIYLIFIKLNTQKNIFIFISLTCDLRAYINILQVLKWMLLALFI
jgi:hypothetical protein